jgi:hypothetical protein
MVSYLSIFYRVIFLAIVTTSIVYLENVKPNSLGEIENVFFMLDKN